MGRRFQESRVAGGWYSEEDHLQSKETRKLIVGAEVDRPEALRLVCGLGNEVNRDLWCLLSATVRRSPWKRMK